jgi:hypothetical protein
MQDGGFLANSAQFLRTLEQIIVDDQCGSHMHQCAQSVQICQRPDQQAKAVALTTFDRSGGRVLRVHGAVPAPACTGGGRT